LPISAEIDARLGPHNERHHAINLISVAVAPVILAPRHFLEASITAKLNRGTLAATFF
jgi:hypothetical protein